jgi:hypothetical protein
VQNHKSALDSNVRQRMDELILEEINAGNYIVTDKKPVIVSALSCVPKSDGDIRPIHDCSLPAEGGLNYYAPVFEHQSYESVDNAVKLIKQGSFLAKIDIHHAYRSVHISEQSYRATGLCWTFLNGQTVTMFDCKLAFGASASPTIFHRLSQAIKRMMARRGFHKIVAFQDDFLLVGDSYHECLRAYTELGELLQSLGFVLNEKKLVRPTTKLVFLGIQIDTIELELSLPDEKLLSIKNCVSEILQKKRVTKRQLQSIAGKLSHAAKVVRGARLFLRRLFNAIGKLRRQNHKTRIHGAVKADLLWWDTFMASFNGVAAFIKDDNIHPVLSDACLYAGGAFCDGDFYYTVWDADYPEATNMCINYKETLIAILAVQRWASVLSNSFVWLYSDNQCAVSIINTCTCKNEIVMQALRNMFWTCSKYNVCLKAFYVAGYLQDIPDAVSRLHETNGIMRVQSVINNWYFCHMHVNSIFEYVNLLSHMSYASLLCILEQVMAWRRVKFRSEDRFASIND